MLPKTRPFGHHPGCRCVSCQNAVKQHNPGYPNTWSCGCGFCEEQYAAFQDMLTKDTIAKTMGHQRAVGLNMASINTCEREGCDTLVKGRALGAINLVFNGDLNGTGKALRLELCPACVKDVHDVLSIPPVTPRERSYSKPYDPDEHDQDDDLSNVSTEQLSALLLERLMKDKKARAIEGSTAE